MAEEIKFRPDSPKPLCGGNFILNPGKKDERVIPNTIVGTGAQSFLKEIFQDIDDIPASFFLGLTNASYTFDAASLTTIAAGEPTVNGYARLDLPRNNTVWNVAETNGVWRARSEIVTFTASGPWDVEWTRAFLCSVASGIGGIVYALTKAIEPQEVLSGQGPAMAYEFWWRA